MLLADSNGEMAAVPPDHAPVANAIGAAIAQIGGEVDRVFSYEKLGREKAIETASERRLTAPDRPPAMSKSEFCFRSTNGASFAHAGECR